MLCPELCLHLLLLASTPRREQNPFPSWVPPFGPSDIGSRSVHPRSLLEDSMLPHSIALSPLCAEAWCSGGLTSRQPPRHAPLCELFGSETFFPTSFLSIPLTCPPASPRPLHSLSPLPVHSPPASLHTNSYTSFRGQLKCHLLWEALLDRSTRSLIPCSIFSQNPCLMGPITVVMKVFNRMSVSPSSLHAP